MKKTFILIVLSIISSIVFSQDIEISNYTAFDELKIGQSEIGFKLNYFTGSNSLNNEFINSFYKGGFIDDELKRSVTLKGNNVLGSNSSLNFTYKLRADSILNIANSSLRFSLSNHLFADVLYNDDYFNLLFFGNANTANADLSGFNFKTVVYQKFTVGLYKKFGGTNYSYGGYAGFSLVKGQNFYSVNIPSGNIITAEYATSIQADLNYEFNRSDSIKSSLKNWLGTGIAGDLYFSVKNMNKNSEFSFCLSNFGGISWNENSLSTNLDTSVTFSGIELNDILDFSFSGTEFLNKDSIIDEFIDNKTNTSEYFTYLPASLALNYRFKSNTLHSEMNIGTQTILFSNMKVPFVYARANTKLTKSISSIFQLSYGGYAGFQIGIGLEASLADKLFIHIFSSNPSSYLLPKSTFGQHLNLSVFYRFS